MKRIKQMHVPRLNSDEVKGMLWELYGLLSKRDKVRLLGLFFLMLVTGVVQMVSVVAVMPFIGMVTNPRLVNSNPMLSFLYTAGGFGTVNKFLIFLGVTVLVLIFVSNFFYGMSIYFQQKFAQNFQVSLGKKIFELYLRQPYAFFLHQNSTNLAKKIIEDAYAVADTLLLSILDLAIGSLISIFLIGLIVFVDPLLAGSVLIFVGIFYAVVYKLYYGNVVRLGEERSVANAGRYKVLSEAFGSIKDTKLYGIEDIFVNRFQKNASSFSRTNSKVRIQVKIPGLALDVIIFGGIMMIVLYMLLRNRELSDSLPVITLYGFTAYRLKPQIQVGFNSMSNINFSKVSLRLVLEDLAKLTSSMERNEAAIASDRWAFKRLTVNNISFKYPLSDDLVVRGVSFTVEQNTSVALVGPSGSGKTTLVDIVLGLLEPQAGQIIVNDNTIDRLNKADWQRKLGYVPQQIYLLDDSIINNIAFGVPSHLIDKDKIEEVVEIADLKNFIGELPEGLNTQIGERGIRLSGGQRQRIGIARAMYRNPSLLILDEATSALDGITEDNIISSLNKLHGKITVIMIAHRLTTIQECDSIVLIESGSVAQIGTFKQLMEESDTFKRMAKLTSF